MLALKGPIEWAYTANEKVNIWRDSESSLQALKSFYVKSKIIQEAQLTLLGNARIRLVWVKARTGIKRNGIADALAKEAATDGISASLPLPKRYLKNQQQLSLSCWQAEWNNGETGRSVYSIIPKISDKQLHRSRKCIQLATGPSPATSRDSASILLRMWGNRKSPSLRNEMPTYFILSPQGTKPTIHSTLLEQRPIHQTLMTKYG
ncbi:hypothetical protein AVEN_75081-1 [Araneus ventricosus]|uniref:RNase H type-1 domain-containing protein n=1 Tax=Araneus ventricosus TaxID=182803 RepID=A0A4Y2PWD2_ARAVE|nr:hypothetical protein AVEN_75081-1 [Araneus ventricosus]